MKLMKVTVMAAMIIGIISIFALVVQPAYALTVWEHYNTLQNFNKTYALRASYWYAQTFTVGSTTHDVTSIRFYGYAVGAVGIPLNLTAQIQAIASGWPSGTDLVAESTIYTTGGSEAAHWITIVLATTTLVANTQYALILSSNGTYAIGNYLLWAADGGNGYPSETAMFSYAPGDWNGSWGDDAFFEIWGPSIVYSTTVTTTITTVSTVSGSATATTTLTTTVPNTATVTATTGTITQTSTAVVSSTKTNTVTSTSIKSTTSVLSTITSTVASTSTQGLASNPTFIGNMIILAVLLLILPLGVSLVLGTLGYVAMELVMTIAGTFLGYLPWWMGVANVFMVLVAVVLRPEGVNMGGG